MYFIIFLETLKAQETVFWWSQGCFQNGY